MTSYIKKLSEKKLLTLPNKIKEGLIYEVIMGSMAYGVSKDNSDMDLYAIAIPPKKEVFPHLDGYIDDFGAKPKKFEVFQKHRIIDGKQNFDISIYSIIKYFNLVLDNNPNMIDSLFVPRSYITYSNQIGEILRANKELFLHKGCYKKFIGYAISQFRKIKNKTGAINEKRKETIERCGYDTKYAYHLVRLLLECEEILMHGTLTLDANIEILSSIRNGDWTLDRVEKWFIQKDLGLSSLYVNSKLREVPEFNKIKEILMSCLEVYYGSIDKAVVINNEQNLNLLEDLKKLTEKYENA